MLDPAEDSSEELLSFRERFELFLQVFELQVHEVGAHPNPNPNPNPKPNSNYEVGTDPKAPEPYVAGEEACSAMNHADIPMAVFMLSSMQFPLQTAYRSIKMHRS